jgi:hypothetical protein
MFQAASIDGRKRVSERFRTGEGVGWHEHDDGLFCGVERSFGANYRAHLVSSWLPAVEGLVDRLHGGARVADVGCGHGAPLILMAQAFPRATFVGYDYTASPSRSPGGAPPRRASRTGCASRSRGPPSTTGAATT